MFGVEKCLIYTQFLKGGEGSEKVYVLYTCENIDIFWPLLLIKHQAIFCRSN